jgi:hypothetical protein
MGALETDTQSICPSNQRRVLKIQCCLLLPISRLSASSNANNLLTIAPLSFYLCSDSTPE